MCATLPGEGVCSHSPALPVYVTFWSLPGFTWVTLQEPQEQCYIMSSGVFDVLASTWVRLQRPQEQRCPVYQCMWCFSVHLGKATTATRTALPSPTSVCDVIVLTYFSIWCNQEYEIVSPEVREASSVLWFPTAKRSFTCMTTSTRILQIFPRGKG